MPKKGALQKRSMRINGHRTSIALEAEFWDALTCIADHRQLSLPKLIGEIDTARGDDDDGEEEEASSLASSVRVYVLQHKRPNGEDA